MSVASERQHAAFGGHGPGGIAAAVEGSRLAEACRGFVTAARLGWQVEANWTDPLPFFVYSVARPIFGTLILVVMVQVISGGQAGPLLAFVVVGSALWSMVTSGIQGLAVGVLEDRERYRMLKYLYVSPTDFAVALLGRGIARITIGAIGALITLALGVAVLGVPLSIGRVDWLLLGASLAIGLAGILALGAVLAAVVLQTRQESWSYPEAVAGALFLVVGAIFPLAVLPIPLQAVGLALPLTWWIAGVREALFPDAVSSIGGAGSLYAALTGRDSPGSGEILVALLATTVLVTLAAALAFRWSERRAKDRGLIDQTTGS
jgi:ABC-2 type transport system permease protein